ncbi:hypothetical protein BDR04DRAFT_177788 [Suillus decipiens]|nr:hypothetical protein BDR04DRAFT_177788 [Suillus decipiens]
MRGSSKILNADFNCSVDSGFDDIATNEPSDVSHIAAARSQRLSSHERIKSAVKILCDGRISIMDFILTILDPSELDFAYNCDWIYKCMTSSKKSCKARKVTVEHE